MVKPLQLPFASREERIAYNEDWSRQLNRQRAEWTDGRELAAGFRCECWQENCVERIQLSGQDWMRVRAEPNRFAVAPHHVADDVEAVVKEFDGFWMVEKFGRAGEVAEQLAD